MTIKRYELLDLSSADGPRDMVTESEEGTYVLRADHVAEVAALKARVAELEASNHRLQEQVDGEDDCRCGQCRFVRLRVAALNAAEAALQLHRAESHKKEQKLLDRIQSLRALPNGVEP